VDRELCVLRLFALVSAFYSLTSSASFISCICLQQVDVNANSAVDVLSDEQPMECFPAASFVMSNIHVI
jgi:hypothetical protein